MRAVCLWSGGKDSCFAYYKAKQEGHKIISLLNFTALGGKTSLSHGLSAELILKQAKTAGLPLTQKAMPKENYRQAFKDLINKWKKKKAIEGIVFGDIYLQEHKEWIDKVCAELAVEAIMPLWGKDTTALAVEFIESGFKAIVVSTRPEFMGAEWLGRKIDSDFVTELKAQGNIDLCGERGEFHSFVYSGPIFSQAVDFGIGKKVLQDKHWFLELV